MFFTVKLKKAWLFTLIGVIILLAVTFSPKAEEAEIGADILRSLGYEVTTPPAESLSVTLPAQDDPVFSEYNILQKEGGFDLTPYAGKKVRRVTFFILREGEPFRANLLFWEDTLIGGDISTVNLNGEMYPLS